MHMTCAKCRYEFCWLCLGDYRRHSAETGIYLCSSWEDVKRLGRAKEEDDIYLMEQEIKRLEFFSSRFKEHQNSVRFAECKVKEIKSAIQQCCEIQPKFSPS